MTAPGKRRNDVYGAAVKVFSTAIIAFGVAILVVTLIHGGGPVSTGFLLGLGFVALGTGRLYLQRR
jgi:hypothetical protein